MIKLECDNCEKTFEVGDEHAGGKVPCPYCDDVNRVPSLPDQPDQPASSQTPPQRDEEQVCIVRPGMFRARPFRYLFILILIFGGFALAISSKVSEQVWSWTLWPALALSGMAILWFATWWLTTHFWVKLIITNKRSIRQEGIIKRHTTEVLHDHIRSVDIRQTLLDRILKIGDLDIDSAGQGGESDIEIQMKKIPRPYEVKKLIDQYRKM